MISPELHRQASEIFDAACELPEGAERDAYLDRACLGSAQLRQVVDSLLLAERQASKSFLDKPAMHAAAHMLASAQQNKAPAAGSIIGNYRIGKQIGAGGMGTVFEAMDLHLNRPVALKTLPSLYTSDRERVERFEREARAASLLNHPNIISIFGAGFDHGHYYIATELVEGLTLRQFAAQGPIERKVLLDLAIQICSALAAAHEVGIVHRDIKPDNVMVRPDGIVKVLDFGLAKLMEEPTRPEAVLGTRPGSVIGTPQYLSPEQVLGKRVGPQSDVFSAGVVLYELASGVRPFDGPTDGAIFDEIVNRPPMPPSRSGRPLDADLEALILRALEKDPELRFQTAQDMRSALRALARGSSISSSSGSARADLKPAAAARPRWPVFAFGALVGMALMAVGWFVFARPASPLPGRFDQMTFTEGEQIFPSLSPDGKQFIYASSARGHWDIYFQRVGGSAAINLTTDSNSDNTEPALSRDGSKIVFRSERNGGGLFVMEATGENPRRIGSRGHLPAWSPDGRSVVYCDDTFIIPNDRGARGSRLHVLDLISNTERDLDSGDAVQPNWSPHGQRIAYWGISSGGNREIFTVAASGQGTPVQVTDDLAVDWNPVWAPSGRELYFISDRGGTMNLWRVPIDESTGKTRGRPEPVTTPSAYVRMLTWSANGDHFLYSQGQNRILLASIEFDPVRLETSGNPTPLGGNYNIGGFSLSPDESKVVHDTVGDIQENLWIVNLDGSQRLKLTSDSFRNRLPRWSPKGDEILFISTRSGQYQEWIVRADGSGLRQVTDAASTVNTGVWSEGGDRVLASLFGFGLALVNPAATRVSKLEVLPGLAVLNGLSYAFTSAPENGLFLGHIAGNGENPIVLYSLAEHQLTRLGVKGMRPAWVPGTHNRYFLFLRQDACFLYDRELKREKQLFASPHNEMYFMQVSASGKRIYFTRTARDSHVWLGEMIP